MTSESLAGPIEYMQAQIRWRWSEIAFWLATLLPLVLLPTYLILASQIAITAIVRAVSRFDPRLCRHCLARSCRLFRCRRLYRGTALHMGLGRTLTGLLAAGLAAGIFGYLTSFIVARFRHLALIMITLGIGLVLQEAANSASWLTGGSTVSRASIPGRFSAVSISIYMAIPLTVIRSPSCSLFS